MKEKIKIGLILALSFLGIQPIFSQEFKFYYDSASKVDSTFVLTALDTVTYKIKDNVKVIYNDIEVFIQMKGKKTVDHAIDFGYHYKVHHMGIAHKNNWVYFLFFITEDSARYATLYAFHLKNKNNYRRLHFNKVYKLNNYKFHDDYLDLNFTGGTYQIKLNKDLRREKFNPNINSPK